MSAMSSVMDLEPYYLRDVSQVSQAQNHDSQFISPKPKDDKTSEPSLYYNGDGLHRGSDIHSFHLTARTTSSLTSNPFLKQPLCASNPGWVSHRGVSEPGPTGSWLGQKTSWRAPTVSLDLPLTTPGLNNPFFQDFAAENANFEGTTEFVPNTPGALICEPVFKFDTPLKDFFSEAYLQQKAAKMNLKKSFYECIVPLHLRPSILVSSDGVKLLTSQAVTRGSYGKILLGLWIPQGRPVDPDQDLVVLKKLRMAPHAEKNKTQLANIQSYPTDNPPASNSPPIKRTKRTHVTPQKMADKEAFSIKALGGPVELLADFAVDVDRYLVMTRMDGTALDVSRNISWSFGRNTLRSFVRYAARELIRHLEKIHKLGLVHRDIRPENMLVTTKHGQLVAALSDFGAIKSALQTDRYFFGTFPSPEVLWRSNWAEKIEDKRRNNQSGNKITSIKLKTDPPGTSRGWFWKEDDLWALAVSLLNLLCGGYAMVNPLSYVPTEEGGMDNQKTWEKLVSFARFRDFVLRDKEVKNIEGVSLKEIDPTKLFIGCQGDKKLEFFSGFFQQAYTCDLEMTNFLLAELLSIRTVQRCSRERAEEFFEKMCADCAVSDIDNILRGVEKVGKTMTGFKSDLLSLHNILFSGEIL